MYTIKDVATKLDISEHTLRYWDNCGFFPYVARDLNNIRRFSDNDLSGVQVVKCLRDSGMSIKSIKKYIDLCIIGDSTINERYEIIKEAKIQALKRLDDVTSQLNTLEKKEIHYKLMQKVLE